MIDFNLPMQDYLDMEAESSSDLKPILISPKDYLWNKTRLYKESPAQSLGTAIHCAVLEPDHFESRYALTLEDLGPRNKGDGYKSWKEMQEKNRGKICLGYEDSRKVLATMDAARSHKGLQSILSSGKPEVTACYQYSDRLKLKARTDWLANDGYIWDVKTTSDSLDDNSLLRTIYKYGYDFQAAHHINVIEKEADIYGFGWVFISTALPATHIITRRASFEMLEKARQKHVRALDILEECLETLEWFGFDDEIKELEGVQQYA